jgi:hypothetical protein
VNEIAFLILSGWVVNINIVPADLTNATKKMTFVEVSAFDNNNVSKTARLIEMTSLVSD